MREPKFTQLKEVKAESGDPSFKIIYENKKINLPFRLEDLPVFVNKEGDKKLETHNHHHRAAWLPRMGIRDGYGNTFFQTTIKGVGYLYPESYESKKDNYQGKNNDEIALHKSIEYSWGYNVLGLVDRRILPQLIKNAEDLNEIGMRCEGIAGAVALSGIMLRGKFVNLKELKLLLKEEARREGIKNVDDLDNFEPVQIVRLVRENARIKDFGDASEEERKKMLAEVFNSLNIEMESQKKDDRYDISKSDSIKKYLVDFFRQSAKNLAILQSEGMVLSYLNSGNITLSLGEVVDLDSAFFVNGKNITSPLKLINKDTGVFNGYMKDARDQLYALGIMFIGNFRDLIGDESDQRRKLFEEFMKEYEANINFSNIKMFGINPKDLIKLVRDYAEKMIANKQSIRAMKF